MASARELYGRVRELLAGRPEPDAKARVIVAHALQTPLGDVFLHKETDAAAVTRAEAMARRCAGGEPVEYVTGCAYFRYCTLEVSPAVLIPRQETERVAGEAIGLIRANGYASALDLCTGSGCIAISLATETQARVDACDLGRAALCVARRNARQNGAVVRFFESDMFAAVERGYDVIVSNPPYVSAEEYAALDEGVRLFEPRLALLAGDDGLKFYRVIAAHAGRYLNAGGALVLEIGAGQAADVTALLSAGGFGGIKTVKDYAGRDRIVLAHSA